MISAACETPLVECAMRLGHPDLAQPLAAAYRAGAEAWPRVELDAETWAWHLGEHLLAADDPVAHVGRLAAADFYLAVAWAVADGDAVAAFDRGYRGLIQKAIRRAGATEDAVDESLQRVCAKLFTAVNGGRPKIAQYTGYGALGQWVRVVATRQALQDRRGAGRRRSQAYADVPEDPAARTDPEAGYLRGMYAAECTDAFAEATRQLSERDRELLGLHVHARANIDDLGAHYGVHRATAARWLAAARAKVLRGAQCALAQRLGADRSTASSIFRFVRSELALSFPRPASLGLRA